jgi:hypothetical protein
MSLASRAGTRRPTVVFAPRTRLGQPCPFLNIGRDRQDRCRRKAGAALADVHENYTVRVQQVS